MDHSHHSLAEDLERMLATQTSRRQSLRWLFASAAAVPLTSCGGGGGASGDIVASSTTSTGSTGTTTTTTGTCSVIPEETGGPYPGDGTNSNGNGIANALALSGIVRSDIRTSVSPGSKTAAGIPTTLKLQIVNVGASCASAAGAAVYLWHCDRDGNYSMYASGLTSENYLRGVQEADSTGTVTFTTVFPGCYSGRMPHIHIEVYRSETTATSYTNKLKTTQLAFPTDVCTTVYGTASGYSASVSNFQQISFATDNVFSDGTSTEMATVTGNVTDGYTVALQLGIAV